jgi:hypothetical protein
MQYNPRVLNKARAQREEMLRLDLLSVFLDVLLRRPSVVTLKEQTAAGLSRPATRAKGKGSIRGADSILTHARPRYSLYTRTKMPQDTQK